MDGPKVTIKMVLIFDLFPLILNNQNLCGIDACGNEIWSYWLGSTIQAILSLSTVDESYPEYPKQYETIFV